MIPWEKRPMEIANLLNPAFCGEIMRRCVAKYQSTSSRPMPYSLLFLVLPIVLHRKTRERMPTTTARKQMHTWLMENQEVKIGFADRSRSLVHITKEAVAFLMQIDTLKINKQGFLTSPAYEPLAVSRQNAGEVSDCYNKAEIVGQWFARTGSAATIYIMWGVKP